jgi:hypothetical protein
MNKNKIPTTRGVSIKTPDDVRRIATRIISDVFRDNLQIDHAGKVNNLLVTWLKAWELQKVSDIDARLKVLEQAKEGKP